jgi:hypothetical protein
MPPTLEIERRIKELSAELTSHGTRTYRGGRYNHRAALALMLLGLGCNVAAAILGIFYDKSGKLVGGLAAIPPLIAFVSTRLKLEGKSSWHYRKSNGLNALRSRLLYQLPESPTFDQVAAIAKARDELNEKMQIERDTNLSFDWTWSPRKMDQSGSHLGAPLRRGGSPAGESDRPGDD